MVNFDKEKPTNKIHDYVTWPSTTQIFEDGRGGLAFPEHNDSHCECDDYGHCTADEGKPVGLELDVNVTTLNEAVSMRDISYTPSYNVNIHKPGTINFRVESMTYDVGSNGGVACTYDTFTVGENTTARFVANSADSLELTKIVNREISIEDDVEAGHYVFSFNDVADRPQVQFTWESNVSFDIEIDLNLDNDIYVYLTHQDDPSENGVYIYTKEGSIAKVASEPVRDEIDPDTLLSDSTVLDNVPCCDHFRKSYTHREVHDRLEDLVGEVTSFGVHSTAYTDCKGGFVDWFTTDGLVNIGNGHESVFVDGFGLGAMYKNSVKSYDDDKTVLPRDDFNENDGTRYPVLTWAYGTRYDARAENNTAALPRDWPFTHITGTQEKPVFNRLNDTNNITLVKKCHAEIDGTLYKLGNLEFDRSSTEHVFYNKHHIVLYPDFSSVPNSNPYSYWENSVVVKPTFIHLPASLDTKDGETVDITVSIQNVDQDDFGTSNTVAALSGYYAAMSQPRVYVMGGVQKFSNKKLPITVSTSNNYSYILSSDRIAYKEDGVTPLPTDTEVRANIVVSPTNGIGDRRTFTAHGIIESNGANGVTIRVGTESDPQSFPYNIHSAEWNRKTAVICGMAYLEPDDNPSDTPLGLVSRDSAMMYNDANINGLDEGKLGQYNKFYTVNGDTDARIGLPHVDKRYVLATVYQNTTSTFPWALSNRRKLAHLERSWTDELHRYRSGDMIGNKHIDPLLKMIYEQNRNMYDTFHSVFSTIKLTPDMNPASYETGTSWKSLGSVIRVKLPETFDDTPVTDSCGNPVRQAKKAYGDLVNDFKRMRLLSYTDGSHARVKVNSWSLSNAEWESLHDDITQEALSSSDIGYQLHNSVWCCNLRSLPDYVLTADWTDDDSMKPIMVNSLILGSDNSNADWQNYVQNYRFPYNKTTDVTKASACVAETESSVVGIPVAYRRYSVNSLVETFANSDKITTVTDQRWLNDMRRYSETVLACKLDQSHYMTLTNSDNIAVGTFDNDVACRLVRDWMFPFTNIQSIDSVPVPQIDDLANILTEYQRAYVSADAVQSYRYEYADSDDTNVDDTISTVSTVMPTDTDLARFLESYVAAYGAKLDKHQYQGSRVLLQNGNLPSTTDSIYINKIDRINRRLKYTDDNLSYYINDNFATIGSSTRDPNVDRTIIQDADDLSGKKSYSLSMSMPPYVTQNFNDADNHVRRPKYMNETYTRVIMQFTFSQKAGRWYTTGYRQHPTTYFTPLYGSDALATTWQSLYTVTGDNTYMIDPDTNTMKLNPDVTNVYTRQHIRPLWRNASCAGFTNYQDHMYALYSEVPPMDITLGCVPFLSEDGTTGVYNTSTDGTEEVGHVNSAYKQDSDGNGLHPLQRLEEPWKDEFHGGINLYPPANLLGANKSLTQLPTDETALTDDGVHANFWSVRKFIRPAVTALAGTDVPGKDADLDPEQPPQPSHYGGKFSDATLYRMFDFPISGEAIYKLPNEMDPEEDMAKQSLLYHVNNYEDILVGKTPQDVILGYGLSDAEQEIDP